MILAIDVGKSKVRVARYLGRGAISKPVSIDVKVPADAIASLIQCIAHMCRRDRVDRIGLSIFGPVDRERVSTSFGSIIGSSDPNWNGINVPRALNEASNLSVYFDMDARLGALGEYYHGSGASTSTFAFLSIGTGIGGALVYKGELLESIDPPQIGHMYVPINAADKFPGSCRFHRQCLQGLASGDAILKRTNIPAHALSADHEVWDIISRYIALGCVNLTYTFSPERIVLGSSVALAPGLLEKVRKVFESECNSFPGTLAAKIQNSGDYIVKGQLTPHAALVGAGIAADRQLGVPFPH